MLGLLVGLLAPKSNDRLVITFGGKAAEVPSDPVLRNVLMGFLGQSVEGGINQVNVKAVAKARGLLVEEIKSSEETDYNEWLHVAAYSDGHKASAGGTILGKKHLPRIVRVFGHPVEIAPAGVLCLFNNKDRPGIVGYIGTLMARYSVNIASMSLHRDDAGGQAFCVLNLDSIPPEELVEQIQKDPDISNLRIVKL
jgi:D-3-phosphoglycerate dehydrogenase